MYFVLKRQTLLLLDPAKGGTIWDRIINTFIVFMIILNTLPAIVETTSVLVFSIEYVLRVWSCTSHLKYHHPFLGILRVFLHPVFLMK